MKKVWIVLLLAFMLTGCKEQKAYETLGDGVETPALAKQMEIFFNLPSDASQQVMYGEENGDIYFCNGYILTVHTTPAGDLQKTFLNATGFSPDQLSVIQTKQGDVTQYSCVFVTAGETGDQVGRCAVLDDGNYHYILTAMADAAVAGELSEGPWQGIFNSLCLIEQEAVVDSGS